MLSASEQGWQDSATHAAAAAGRSQAAPVAKLLLEQSGAAINAKDDDSGTDAHVGCLQGGDLEITQAVDWTRGADVNARTQRRRDTFCGYAEREGILEIVKLLIDKGADINAENNDGVTALGQAAI